MNEETQLSCFREAFYRRERRSVPVARGFAARALTDWGVVERADDVLLCVSELTTNALLHGVPPGRGFRLHLHLARDGRLRVEVHDSGPGVVRTPRPPDAVGVGGRGLVLVAALADKWGVGERRPGKVVWCEFDVPVLGAEHMQSPVVRLRPASLQPSLKAPRPRGSAGGLASSCEWVNTLVHERLRQLCGSLRFSGVIRIFLLFSPESRG